MQRSLEYYFKGESSGVAAVSGSSSGGAGTNPPVVLRIGARKRPVGRPRKASKPATHRLVDYSSTETEESSNESPPMKKRIHRMYSQGQKRMVAYYARHHGIRKAARHYGIRHRNVQRWVKDQVVSLNKSQKTCKQKGSGPKDFISPRA